MTLDFVFGTEKEEANSCLNIRARRGGGDMS